jgi:hypothetical protein
MSYYIYGFRIKGDPECRYVGQTSRTPEDRLFAETSYAKRSQRWFGRDNEIHRPDGFYQWLIDHDGDIEAFRLAKVETRAEALATERVMVALVLRLGHRLFNRHLVPAELRIPRERVKAA